MPKIYTDLKKQEIKEQLLASGLALMKQFGMKKWSIESVTKKTGIAQGTFYKFFPSKEMLFYALAERYQAKINAQIKSIIAEKACLDREDLRTLYLHMMLEDDDNVLRHLSRDDMQILVSRLPHEYFNKITDTKAEIERHLSDVKVKRNDCDINAIINWIQVMNMTLQNKDLLVEAGIEKIIRILIENMLNEIFVQERTV